MHNLEDMEKFLETYNLLRLMQKETENLNRSVISKEIESVIKDLPMKKNTGPDGFTSFTKQELIPIIYKHLKKNNNNQNSLHHKNQNSLYEASIILIPRPERDTTRKSQGNIPDK